MQAATKLILPHASKSSDAKNSDRGGIEPITERGEKITAEKAQKILLRFLQFRQS